MPFFGLCVVTAYHVACVRKPPFVSRGWCGITNATSVLLSRTGSTDASKTMKPRRQHRAGKAMTLHAIAAATLGSCVARRVGSAPRGRWREAERATQEASQRADADATGVRARHVQHCRAASRRSFPRPACRGDMRLAVALPDGENEDEWLAMHSAWAIRGTRVLVLESQETLARHFGAAPSREG